MIQKMSDFDLGRTYDRLDRSEKSRARVTGDGTTRQGRALCRKYSPQLADRIAADPALPSDRKPWSALKDIEDGEIAARLMTAGISVAAGERLSIDRDGHKNFRDIVLWIG